MNDFGDKMQGLEPFFKFKWVWIELVPSLYLHLHLYLIIHSFLLFSFFWMTKKVLEQVLHSLSSLFKIKHSLLNTLPQQDMKMKKNTKNIQVLIKFDHKENDL